MRAVPTVAVGVLVGAVALQASAGPPDKEGAYGSPRPAAGDRERAAEHRSDHPRPRRGYTSYAYPGVDSCRCARGPCFHPARYYCGGEQHRRSWLRRWLGAHFGGGSMLDGYCCECVFPTVRRPHVRNGKSSSR